MKRLVFAAVLILALLSACTLILRSVTSSAGSRLLSVSEVKRIVEAPSKYTYSAVGETKSWYSGKVLSSKIKLFHESPDKHRIEYLTPPLKGVVIIDDGTQLWRFDPKLQATVGMDAGGCLNADSRLDLLLGNYRIEEIGGDRVADRRARALVVKSKSGHITKRLWIDEKTRVILRSEDYDAEGKLQSTTRFDSIDYAKDLSDSLFERPSAAPDSASLQGTGKSMTRDELSKAAGFEVKLPRYIPEGYKLGAYRLYECPCLCGHRSAYVRYTNGLSSISIFETRENSSCVKEDRCRLQGGRCSLRDQTAIVSHEGKSFIIIAEVGLNELQKIADSLR